MQNYLQRRLLEGLMFGSEVVVHDVWNEFDDEAVVLWKPRHRRQEIQNHSFHPLVFGRLQHSAHQLQSFQLFYCFAYCFYFFVFLSNLKKFFKKKRKEETVFGQIGECGNTVCPDLCIFVIKTVEQERKCFFLENWNQILFVSCNIAQNPDRPHQYFWSLIKFDDVGNYHRNSTRRNKITSEKIFFPFF